MGFLSNLFGGKTSEVEQSATEDGRTAEASPQAAPRCDGSLPSIRHRDGHL